MGKIHSVILGLLFLTGCAVVYHTDSGEGTTAGAWGRFKWTQIDTSTVPGSVAATNANNVGEWKDELKVFDSPPSAVFTLNGTTFTLDSSQFNLDGGTNPMFIDFDYSGQSGNSWDVFGPSGERLLMDADNLYWESRYGNKLELHNSSVTQDFVLTINPDNGTGDARIVDSRGTTTGLEYNADYSAGFTARTLVDKAYTDAAAANGGIYGGSGTIPTPRTINTDATVFWDLRGNNIQYEITGDSIDWLINTRDGLIVTDIGTAFYNVDFSEPNSTAFMRLSGTGYENRLDVTSSYARIFSQGSIFSLNADSTAVFTDNRTTPIGITYASSTYRNNFVDTSIVDKGYVDGLFTGDPISGTVGTNELAYGTAADSLTSDARLTINNAGVFRGLDINDNSKLGSQLRLFSNNASAANAFNSVRYLDNDNDNADFYGDQLDSGDAIQALWATIPVKDSANMKGGASDVEVIKHMIITADEAHTASTFGTAINLYVREKNNTSTDTKMLTLDSNKDIILPQVDADSTAAYDLGITENGALALNGDYGSASDTTDGSGDITVSHSLGTATIYVTATATGTTFYNVTVHTKTSTTFKIRFFNAAGSAVTSTAVTADWIAKK